MAFPQLQFNAPNIKSPFEIEQGYQQIQQGQNQNRLAQMQFKEAARVDAERNALTQAAQQYGNTPEYGNELLKRGLVKPYQDHMKFQAEQQKAARDTEKANIESHLQKFEVIGQIMGGVRDEQSWQSAKQQIAQVLGPESVSAMPQNYDPAVIEQNRIKAMTVKQQLEQKRAEIEAGFKERDFRLDAANKAFNPDGTPNQAYQNYSISKATAGATQNYGSPVAGVGPDGKPVFFQPSKGGGAPSIVPGVRPEPKDKAQNITEGERKAATLLRRLDFSEKQLQAALADNAGAAKPELLQNGLRAIGAEAAANSLTGSERQRVESAQLDILDAALTLGTGAAYTKEQLEGYRKSYFPQIGDGPDQIKDKAARLKNVIEAAKIAAGRAAPTVSPQPAAKTSGVLSPSEILNVELQDALKTGNTQNVEALRREMKARKIRETAGMTSAAKPASRGVKFLGFE